MKRINFKDVNKLISVVTSLDESLGRMSEEASSREEEIRTFEGNLRKVMEYAEHKQGGENTPERLQ